MKWLRLRTCPIVVTAVLVSLSARGQSVRTAERIWAKLEFKTAWLALGPIQRTSDGGVGQWLANRFEWVDRPGRAPRREVGRLPRIGERLRLRDPLSLEIVEYTHDTRSS